MHFSNLELYTGAYVVLGLTVGGLALFLERLALVAAGKRDDVDYFHYLFGTLPLVFLILMLGGKW